MKKVKRKSKSNTKLVFLPLFIFTLRYFNIKI